MITIYLSVYLDFSEAFDKIPHQRLLKMIRVHKIDRKMDKEYMVKR